MRVDVGRINHIWDKVFDCLRAEEAQVHLEFILDDITRVRGVRPHLGTWQD